MTEDQIEGRSCCGCDKQFKEKQKYPSVCGECCKDCAGTHPETVGQASQTTYTGEEVIYDKNGQVFNLTPKLRWVSRAKEKTLQQMRQGSHGDITWEDVPTEDDELDTKE